MVTIYILCRCQIEFLTFLLFWEAEFGLFVARGGGRGVRGAFAAFDAIWRGVDARNNLLCQRILKYMHMSNNRKCQFDVWTCLGDVAEQRLGAGVSAGEYDANESLGLMKTCFNGIYVALGWASLPGRPQEGAGWMYALLRRIYEETRGKKERTGGEHNAALARFIGT
jgi:hypothetical protein